MIDCYRYQKEIIYMIFVELKKLKMDLNLIH